MVSIFNRFEYFFNIPVKYNDSPIELWNVRRHKKSGQWQRFHEAQVDDDDTSKYNILYDSLATSDLELAYLEGKLNKYKG